jgi:hypothetical protein
VGDPLEPVRREFHRADENEVAHAHVLHRPNRGGDVHDVLWLEEHQAHAVQH